ncbi:hypothetical protein Misp06_02117 [Microbulbifer sp. NBRC 101763]|uniref:hypothetical protein n=1 Tax=Microbulbifer TaxID=48073 RepID=UPI00037999D2|nr:hypothetical protein [Microbulbifer variabilis]
MPIMVREKDNNSKQVIARLATATKHHKPDEVEWGNDRVNCYAWAANCEAPNSGKPNPGSNAGYVATLEDASLIEGAKRDGMAYVANAPANKPPPFSEGCYCVALYKSATDHHWYRRDPKTGTWTHKPGPHGVRNYGPNFVVLPEQLETANHNYGLAATNYRFVAYFYVVEEGIQV